MKRVIVITGTSRGLGKALAQELQSEHHVFGCGRSSDGAGRYQSLDLARPKEVDDWALGVLEEVGPPHLLINCAAQINRNAPLWEVPPQEFSDLITVNLAGIHHAVRAFLPSMLEAQRGVVVNFSSYWGRGTAPEVAPYCASKWGVEGLTKALAQELPSGLAAVALNPGIIDTEMLRSCFGEQAGSYEKPQEWAKRAAPMVLGLGPKDNGASLTV